MSFASEQERWIKRHLKRRTGERLDALKRGHGFGNQLFAEKVWWLLVGHFGGLHPEYEVRDWRGRPYFVDFMWIVGALRIAFEIMDYGSHGTDRSKFRLDLNRGLYLQTQGCIVFYISLDELRENPEFILAALRSALAPYLAAEARSVRVESRSHSRIERELMRCAIRHDRIVRPAEAAKELELHIATVIKYCRLLADKGKFRAVPSGTSGRVHSYEYMGMLQSPELV
ncbi:hypothetical protein [Cohnella fermenti]|uniref:DUF559 domain-containing protein n=1 Tax=Cohnella fermenti TaxID=2565925 RepID=A0A4S4BQ85_9BACL|nr:hypothetical protein [Cohnella fermenti]THF76257.1 hypothetical protein E6C55_19725 [Cohnella fermenti]